MKKVLLSLGVITSVALPATLVISCDSETKDFTYNIDIQDLMHKQWVDEEFMESAYSNINVMNIRTFTFNITNIHGAKKTFIIYVDEPEEQWNSVLLDAYNFASTDLTGKDMQGFMAFWDAAGLNLQ